MKKLIKFALLCFAAIGITHSASAQVTLKLVPVVGGTTTLGTTATYNLTVSGLQFNPDATTPSLGMFDVVLDISNPSVCLFDSATFGNGITDSLNVDAGGNASAIYTGINTSVYSVTSNANAVELYDLSFGSVSALEAAQTGASTAAKGSITLAQLTFDAVGVGTSSIAFDVTLLDPTQPGDTATNLADEFGNTLPVTTETAATMVVPEPNVASSLLIGALGLLGWAWKTRRPLLKRA